MTLIEEYKAKMFDVIEMVYNNQLDPEKVKSYINSITKTAEQTKLRAIGRNLYKYIKHEEYDPNEMLNIISSHHLNILSNGLYTENFDPPSSDIIALWMNKRDELKKEELEALEANDLDKFRTKQNKEIKTKQDTNSMYGAATMQKSYVSNVDVGGSITAQARNFISEMLWSIEKFLASNLVFSDISELISWMETLFKKKRIPNEELMSYITYIPTSDDCRKRFIYTTKDVDNIRKNIQNMEKSIFLMFDCMDEYRRIIYYYACNPIELISKNDKIKKIMYEIITNGVEYINPYKFPDEMKSEMDIMLKLMRVFCFSTISTYDRVVKYQTRKRRVCLLSDTDSTMPTMYKCVLDTLSIYGMGDAINDELISTKLVMFYVYITTALLDDACMNFAMDCNSQIEGRKFRLKMKNEYFFSIILLYPVKKNYIGIQKLKEGKVVPESKQLAITGRSLGSSSLNQYVSNAINDILENKVLRSKNYDPLDVLHGVHEIQEHIEQSILNGDKTFGIIASFNGTNQIKDVERTAVARSSLVWNSIYPNDVIVPGDKVYTFDTVLRTEDDLNRIDPKYNDIKEKIRAVVFRKNSYGYDFSRFGLKLFAIPMNGDAVKIPEWIIPFISIDTMIQKHLQPIVALYKNLGLSPCQFISEGSSSSVKKLASSNLINF
jgi:hypothetical protein